MKRNPLKAAIAQQEQREQKTIAPVAEPSPAQAKETASRQASRVGRVFVGGYFAPEVQTEMKIIAAQERTTVQELVAEGINAVFARRQKPQIASLSPQDNG
jgi:hypothetical protein